MIMETKRFNERESLELISQMIENSKQNLDKGDGNVQIVWGLSTLISATLVVLCLYLTHGNPNSHWLWMINIVLGVTGQIRASRAKRVYTKIDRLISSVWRVIVPICVLLPIVLVVMGTVFDIRTALQLLSVIPMIEILIVSCGITISGLMLGFRAMLIGGIVGMCISMLMIIPLPYPYLSHAWWGVWALSSMIIPGIKLNRYARKNA